MSILRNKHILVGVSGSIAAFKACELIRLLTASGATCEVAMTDSAQEFIGVATLQALSSRPVVEDMWSAINEDGMDHIASVRRADLYVIAPASASTIAKLATGSAADAVSALACAATCPVLVAPAMNVEMWSKPAVQRNVATLQEDGVGIVETRVGDLACGEYGEGRLAEPNQIIEAIEATLAGTDKILKGRTIAVTTGATFEAIDDMRIITNKTTGKMGCAMAQALRDAGAKVHLIAGRVDVALPHGMASIIRVSDIASLQKVSQKLASQVDAYIAVAAVSDYKPKKRIKGKLPRSTGNVNLDLVSCPDVVAGVASLKQAPFCIAFAAESGTPKQVLESARKKLKAKAVQAIVLSPIASNLGGDSCNLTYIAGRSTKNLGKQSKRSAAAQIAKLLAKQL